MKALAELLRPALAWLAALVVAILALVAIAAARGESLERVVPYGLLAAAVLLLGALWALRSHLAGGRVSTAPTWGALVPLVAAELFLLPSVLSAEVGRTDLPLVLALLAVPLERLWARWVLRVEPQPVVSAGLGGGAPLLALGLVAADGLQPGSAGAHLTAWVAAIAYAVLAAWRASAVDAEIGRLVTYVDRLQWSRRGLQRPPPPPLATPALRRERERVDAEAERMIRPHRVQADREEEAERGRQLRTRFMAAMSHELRSPLNSVVGFAQVLERELSGPLTPDQRESVAMVRRSAEELLTVLTDVLDLARLEAGRLSIQPSWVPSVEILTEAVRRGQVLVAGRDIVIEPELQPGLPPVHVDEGRVVQSVVALFRSAALRLRGGTIRLRARVASGPPGPTEQVRVEIRDILGALPRAEAEAIFDAFREIREPRGRRLGGLGMALSLARALVRLHGGDVWAADAGGETVLCVALPIGEG